MTLNDIKNFMNYVIDITRNGNKLKPLDFNNLLKNYYLPYFRIKVKEYTTGQITDINKSQLFYNMLESMSTTSNVTIATGNGNMPATFGAWNEAYGTYNGVTKRIELISESDRIRRMNDILSPSFEYFPACIVRGGVLTVYPNNIDPVTLIHYTKPAQPVYDYYINASGKEIYMTEGQTGVSVPTGGSTSSGTAGPVTIDSSTIELDFPEDLHEDFTKYLLGIIGIKLSDIAMTQYMEQQKQSL